ncbi:MAG: hypothetical protein ACLSCE_01870 [Bacteroides cellulosilyticus]
MLYRKSRVAPSLDALQQSYDEMEECKQAGNSLQALPIPKTETPAPELLVEADTSCLNPRKSGRKNQRKGLEILFKEYPDIQMAYGLLHSLRMIFAKNTIKDRCIG